MHAPRFRLGLGSLVVAVLIVLALGVGTVYRRHPQRERYGLRLQRYEHRRGEAHQLPQGQDLSGGREAHQVERQGTGGAGRTRRAGGSAGTQGRPGTQGDPGPKGDPGPAGTSGSSNWGDIANKPADLADGQIGWGEVANKPADLADGQIGWGEVANKPAGFADGADDVGYYSGVQINSTLGVGANHYWFTFGWPSTADIMWSAIPTTTGGKVKLDVEVERAGDGTLTYYLRVTNIGAAATDYKVRRTTFNVGIAPASKGASKAKAPKWLKNVGVERVK